MTSPRNVIEVTTSSDSRPSVPSGSSMFFGTQGIFIILGAIMALLIILILLVLCFKARNSEFFSVQKKLFKMVRGLHVKKFQLLDDKT